MRTKQEGNTATPSSDSEREAKTREVPLPYPTLIEKIPQFHIALNASEYYFGEQLQVKPENS